MPKAVINGVEYEFTMDEFRAMVNGPEEYRTSTPRRRRTTKQGHFRKACPECRAAFNAHDERRVCCSLSCARKRSARNRQNLIEAGKAAVQANRPQTPSRGTVLGDNHVEPVRRK